MVKGISIFCCLFLLLSFFRVQKISAASSIVINELMPHPASGADWIELYNPTGLPVDLAGWQLKDSAASAMKTLSGTLAGDGYFVVDLGTRLNNGGDTVALVDSSNQTVDSYTYTSDPGLDKTLGRSPNGSGGFGIVSSATKGAANSSGQPAQTSQPSSTPTQTPTSQASPQVSATPVLATNIHLSEFLPNPATGEQEWVELYNADTSEAFIGGLKIDDADGGSSPYTIPSEGNTAFIPPLSYKVIILASSKFNNSGDMVRLLMPDGSVIEEIHYDKTDQNTSWAKDAQGIWRKTTLVTPGNANSFSDTSQATSQSVATASPLSQPTSSKASGVVLAATDAKTTNGLTIAGSIPEQTINETLPVLALAQTSVSPIASRVSVAGVRTSQLSLKVIQYVLGTLLMLLAGAGYLLFRQYKARSDG